ncbi:uncharacterized protein KIAA0408 homolog [Varanus komodoensis]|uniref:KIAA0408 n=1 Tax=Varanus komodoensis TaxID=61221 RepID=A0A8D2L558_VARKO|nr:uncharacterized protein KIAA0408 homolog [Varanus komodoensis]XP_044280892.1 uncharacterized protein KIAA0408 homolog [Varanus komodoensis]XP_044280901.1 uncharacterized protein KIAA0408 homolog [Varanus komodoensis]
MELQTQLENMTERNWNKEKMELLERFDNERKEWECQWKVMQKKIEELYQEVKLRRESNMNAFENKAIHNKAPQQSHFPTLEWSDTPGLNSWSLDKASMLPRAEKESKDTRNRRRNNALSKDNLDFESSKESGDFPGLKTTKNYTQDLNIALKELAKVSEDLCSYQEEIRKKSNHRRKKLFPFLEESVETENIPEVNHTNNKDTQPVSTAAEKEEQNNRKNLMGTSRCLKEMPPIGGVEKTSFLPWQKREAPPVPPRSTSRHLTNSLAHVSEALAKDTGHKTNGKTQDYLDGIPAINPPFGKQTHASVLPTNEWKSVTGPAGVTIVPTTEQWDPSLESKFPAGFCHNTWSCDTSPVGDCPRNGSFSHSVQKSCSDGDMVPQQQHPKLQSGVHYSSDIYTPACDTLGDSGYGTGKTQRNETLEAKIDEFNRTVFHTDKGQRCLQQTQMLPVPSGDPKPHCILEDRTQNEEESTSIVNPGLPSRKEGKPSKPNKHVKATGQQKQLNGFLSGYQHMLHEHDWRPSNLSGRPRSADSRSNYGVVEKLLKNYEKSTSLWSSRLQKEQWMQPNSESADGGSEKSGPYFEMFQADQGKQEQQKNSIRHIGLYTKHGKEKQKFPEVFVPAKQSNGKGFSRPARPANRRLPSRWASRSPSAPPAVRRTTLNELS